MKAVKLTKNSFEKKQLVQRFNAVADVARSMKSGEWTPTKPVVTVRPEQQPVYAAARPKSKADGIGEWVVDVAQAFDHVAISSHPPPTYATKDSSSAARVAALSTLPQGRSVLASPSPSPSRNPTLISAHANAKHENHWSHNGGGTSQSQLHTTTQEDARSRIQEITQKGLPSTGTKNPVSHIRKLREPVSSRKRTTKEEIILLKASFVNDMKCPPWDKIPSADEFVANDSGDFVYVFLLPE